TMPKVSRESAAQYLDHGPVMDATEDVDGYTINFVTFKVDATRRHCSKGCPAIAARAHIGGYVFKGRVVFTTDNGEEVHVAGDASYVPAGHLQRADAGTGYLQFSPAVAPRIASETMSRNMRQMQRA